MALHPKSILLVTLQFLLIGLLLAGASFQKTSLIAAIFIALAMLLVTWAVVAMQKSKLSILPEPSTHAVLITNGPYRFIRHPMYAAILIGCAGLLINHFTWIGFSISVALAMVLIFKLGWEEKMLTEKFGEYAAYRKHTSRLIPFVY